MIHRTIEKRLLEMIKVFPVLIISGARQVGKTTVLQILRKENQNIKPYNYLSLDNPILKEEAKRDPLLFLQRHKAPLIIDEIQYAPELLTYIKIIVDEQRLTGRKGAALYVLTGSQMFRTMKNVSESLAGRIGILNLYGLSNSELMSQLELPFLPTDDRINMKLDAKYHDVNQVYERIFRGSYPELYKTPELSTYDFYASYVQTYIERDIKDIINIKDEMKFLRFISLAAARTGQELIFTEISKACEIDIKTIQSWISVLQSSGVIVLLQPYNASLSKRIIKRPKLYFMDTGLACFLARFTDAKTLEISQMAGAIFETYVVSEIIKSYENNGKRFNGYYYRDNDQREIDLLIEENGKIYPLEIKKSSNPKIDIIKNFNALKRFNIELGNGGILCMSDYIVALDSSNNIIPIKCI